MLYLPLNRQRAKTKYVGSCDRSITKKSDLANGMNDKPKQSHKKRDSMRIEDESTLEFLFNNMLSLSMDTSMRVIFNRVCLSSPPSSISFHGQFKSLRQTRIVSTLV